MNYFIGLDIGTTGVKALLLDVEGNVQATSSSEYTMNNPQPLWAEQNPDDWWLATQKSIKKILEESKIKAENIKGIGLSGQMHGLVLLDKYYKVVRPCIMWNDQRTIKECEDITLHIGFDKLLNITGNSVLPGFTAPKILWVRKNEPDKFENVEHILLPKDYIRFCLTGELATDVSDASGTSLLNVEDRDWSEDILSKLEISKSWLPKVYESTTVTGFITKSASEKTGLKIGTPIVSGGGDQAAGGIGTGVVREGITSVVLGTSGVVFSHSDKLKIEPKGKLHAFCHASPGKWHLMGVTLSAAGSFRWFRDTFAAEAKMIEKEKNIDAYELLTSEASEVPAGSEGLFFLPYLTGERTPYPDPDAKGTFTGITIRHKRNHFIRSILEGVAFSLKDCLELIKDMGINIEEVRLSGGGAKSPLWRQILSDVFDTELVTLNSTEGASYGAALLAAVGTDHFGSVEEACEATLKPVSKCIPNSKNVDMYSEAYKIYKELYPTLKNQFKMISKYVEK